MVIYGGVNVGEPIGDVCMPATSGVPGRKDRGGEGRIWDDLVYAGKIPGSPGVYRLSEAMSSDEWNTKRWPFVTRFVAKLEVVHRAH